MTPDGSTLQALAGRVPDAEVAARADVTLEQVRAYRRFHRIPPFVRVPPPSVVPTPALSTSTPKRRPAAAAAPAPAPAPAPARAPKPDPTPEPKAEPPPPVVRPRVVQATSALAFTVAAARGEDRATFIVVGRDILAVTRRAMSALQARVDGPWVIEQLSFLGDAIEEDTV